jgi:hypothetical protein
VFVGLPEDSQYWARIAEAPSAVTVYLRRLALRQQDVAESLAPSLNEHRSVVGWYIPQEIDDVNWNDAERRAILSRHLQQLTTTLRRAAPERRIAISGFSNAHLAPRGLAAFWRELVMDAGLDALFFQDGIGAGKLQLEELEAYLPPLQEMCDNSRCELRMIVELFQSAEGGRFEPAAIDRIGRQLQLAAAMTRRPPLAFSIPDYMLPAGGPDAGRLLRAYSERLR